MPPAVLHQLLASREWLAAVATALLLLGGAVALGRLFARDDYPYVRAPGLLTPAERVFYAALRDAAGEEYALFAKVRLADIVQVRRGLERRRYMAAFSRVRSKHADFVLCDPETFDILAVVELDDRSHDLPARQERDRFFESALAAAAVPLLRVPVRRQYDPADLEAFLADVLASRKT